MNWRHSRIEYPPGKSYFVSMSKPQKILIGILTLLPLLLILGGVGYWFRTVFQMVEQSMVYGTPDDVSPFFIFGGLVLGASLLSIGLTVYYCIHASRNRNVPPSMRTAWIVINIFAGSIGHIIYYFQYILTSPEGSRQTPYRTRSCTNWTNAGFMYSLGCPWRC